ncbi:MAG: AlpA family phage regulatory protein, partial [Oxalobacteraceae bacterium]
TEGLPAPVRILRLAEVIHIVGLGRAPTYRQMAQRIFQHR